MAYRPLSAFKTQEITDIFKHDTTFNIWRTVMSGTWKYDDPRLKMSHEGAGNDCLSYVLSYDQLQESWIISKLKGKLILKQQSNKRQLLFLITVRG